MSEHKHTPGPWRWTSFGDNAAPSLFTAHSGALVVLSARREGMQGAKIETRDEQGVLVPITADHPNARLIAAAPDLYDACNRALDYLRIFEQEEDEYGQRMGDVLRAALAKAKGGVS